MAYAISAADITKLYLYGSTSVPNDLTSLAVPNLLSNGDSAFKFCTFLQGALTVSQVCPHL